MPGGARFTAAVNRAVPPAVTVVETGIWAKVGMPPLTTRVTTLVTAVPMELVASNRNWSPDMALMAVRMARAVVRVPVKVALAEESAGGSAGRFTKSPVPPARRCHCSVGAGLPEMSAEKAAPSPSLTAAFSGCRINCGARETTSVPCRIVWLRLSPT